MRNAKLVQLPLRGSAHRHLVHQVAAQPEAAAKVVVPLGDKHFLTGPGQVSARHQSAGTTADDDAVTLGILHKLFDELTGNGTGYFLFTDRAKLFSH